jgi:membrane protein DedA with SNARE-associated domain
MLRSICRLSLSRETCVGNTAGFFERWGPRLLLVSKFVPGVSTVALPMAGASGVTLGTGLVLDLRGALLWTGSGVLRVCSVRLPLMKTSSYWVCTGVVPLQC